MIDLLSETSVQQTIAAALLAALAAGIAGALVVVKRISSITGGLAHAAFGGVGLGLWAGVDPVAGAGVFALGCALLIGWLYRRLGTAIDVAVSVMWAAGMAIGVLLAPPGTVAGADPADFLFGSIGSVTPSYLTAMAVVDGVLILGVVLLYRALAAVAFDEEFAEVTGMPVTFLITALLLLVALAVVTLIRVVGIILAIAFLTLPAEAARRWTNSLAATMAAAAAVAAGCGVAGTAVAAAAGEVPAGPLIVLFLVGAYAASAGLYWLSSRRARLLRRLQPAGRPC